MQNMNGKRYTDVEKTEFCELAQVHGIRQAIRELKYPSYPVAVGWMEKRGIRPELSNIMETARKYHTFYTTEDLLASIDNAMSVVQEMYATVETADEAKKLAEAVQKLVNTRLLLEGKATVVTEKRETTQQDLEIAAMLRAEQTKQDQMS
jgi:hypothetical protein